MYSKNDVYRIEYNLVQYDRFTFDIEKIKYCRQSGFELIRDKVAKTAENIKNDSDEIKRISISRTKRRLKEICLCNSFTHFITFTVNSENCDRFSLDEVQDKLKAKNKYIKSKYKDYKYVFVTEKHENGAFHFHGLIKGLSIGNGLVLKDNGYLTIPLWSDFVGFDSVQEITKGQNDYNKLCSYIQKYISKDMVKKYKGQLYFCSKGLKRADRYIIKDLPSNFEWDFDNDFVSIKNFNYKNVASHSDLDFTIISEKKFLDFFKN